MSWATCYSGSNNIHFGFPPIMSDGRNYSNYQRDAVINNTLKTQAGIKSNYDYRAYLTKHGKEIMEYNTMLACSEMSGKPYYTTPSSQNTPHVPYTFNCPTDNSQPYGYENSDLKNLYVNAKELEARRVAPQLNQTQVFLRKCNN